MPSAVILAQKQATVKELSDKLKTAKSAVIVNYQGITVDNDTKMRAALRNAGVDYKVYKNSIIGRACAEAGYGELSGNLAGMTAIAVSQEDEVAAAKILKEYADKIETFNLVSGIVDGGVLDTNGVTELANIPGKDTLVCKIMGCMKSPLFKLAYVLQAIIDKDGEGTPAAEEAAE